MRIGRRKRNTSLFVVTTERTHHLKPQNTEENERDPNTNPSSRSRTINLSHPAGPLFDPTPVAYSGSIARAPVHIHANDPPVATVGAISVLGPHAVALADRARAADVDAVGA